MSDYKKLYVVKRIGGRREEVIFDKIQARIQLLCYDLDSDYIDPSRIAMKVIQGLYPGVTTAELDVLAAEIAASMMTIHTDYGLLAARITISRLHKTTDPSFSAAIAKLYEYGMIAQNHYNFVMKHHELLDDTIDTELDYKLDYFGIKTLEKSYLLRGPDNEIMERPQYLWMRVAIGIHGTDLAAICETYTCLSKMYFIHATPTLFAAATTKPQLSSCYLLTIKGDSIREIFETVGDCAAISKTAGGIGLAVNSIRANGTRISGTNGTSNGLVPMLRVFNNVARYVDQGGGKRMGSFAIYVEPWHADIFEFLDLKKNHGSEELRARDLFYGLWIPDLFMKRVAAEESWSLMCPHQCPGLSDCWGEVFEQLYTRYEREGKFIRQVPARQLWYAIMEAQVETGTPYMMYKDACNRKSNQQNLGTIHCGNLCTEIVQYSAPDEIAVCNLASLALSRFVNLEEKKFNFQMLHDMTKIVTRNINKCIDVNLYPVPEAETSNMRHRPIGIGVQGFADALIMLRLPYESDEARLLNLQIFETIYHAALEASCELAAIHGTYETYDGSPVSRGILQFDMWTKKLSDPLFRSKQIWNWQELREKIARHGVRNSLLVAPMPTATTAQIIGNNESFEPFTSNIYVRRVLSGEFNMVNKYLVRDLVARGLWTDTVRNLIIENRGSIQKISLIPAEIRDLYKTVWEISVKHTINMAADRGLYIDQSQSFSIHLDDVNYSRLTSIHFYAWKLGLKTGMYYLRTKAAANAIQFTVDRRRPTPKEAASSCSRDECIGCSS